MSMIRATTIADIGLLPDIERSAGAAFRSYPELAWIADDEVMGAAEHARLVGLHTSWVAEFDSATSAVCGFLCAEPFLTEQGRRELHIWELSVASGQQGQGIGRALMNYVIAFARGQLGNSEPFSALTLTTFRDVKFNAPFYAELGFVELFAEGEGGEEGEKEAGKEAGKEVGARLRDVLAAEAAHGLPAERRCAMRYKVS